MYDSSFVRCSFYASKEQMSLNNLILNDLVVETAFYTITKYKCLKLWCVKKVSLLGALLCCCPKYSCVKATNLFVRCFSIIAEPHGSVVSVADLRKGGGQFDPQLGQYSLRGLKIVIPI